MVLLEKLICGKRLMHFYYFINCYVRLLIEMKCERGLFVVIDD